MDAAAVLLDALKRAASAPDRGGLTKAGRALENHGSRDGSAFPQVHGDAAAKNRQGQAILEAILDHPQTVKRTNRFGGYDWIGPDGRGARFNADGSMKGFLEP